MTEDRLGHHIVVGLLVVGVLLMVWLSWAIGQVLPSSLDFLNIWK